MRGYEVAHLTAQGPVEDHVRLAPAIPAFESCFAAIARGAIVTTSTGPRAVEDLMPGDQVMTTSHGMQTLLWRGKTQVVPGQVAPGSSLGSLIRLTQDALGLRKPTTDLVLGPAARIAYRGRTCKALTGDDTVFVPAEDLIDHDTVIELRPASAVDVYQLGFLHHARIAVQGGIEIESLHPGRPDRISLRGENLRLLMSMFPHKSDIFDFGPLLHPRRTMRDLMIDAVG